MEETVQQGLTGVHNNWIGATRWLSVLRCLKFHTIILNSSIFGEKIHSTVDPCKISCIVRVVGNQLELEMKIVPPNVVPQKCAGHSIYSACHQRRKYFRTMHI